MKITVIKDSGEIQTMTGIARKNLALASESEAAKKRTLEAKLALVQEKESNRFNMFAFSVMAAMIVVLAFQAGRNFQYYKMIGLL